MRLDDLTSTELINKLVEIAQSIKDRESRLDLDRREGLKQDLQLLKAEAYKRMEPDIGLFCCKEKLTIFPARDLPLMNDCSICEQKCKYKGKES